MRAPAFWWREPGTQAALLAPFAFVYGAVATLRLRKAGARVGIPVVCLGNPTVGGAGKTPTALAVASVLAASGEKPIFLTRGYGGNIAGPVLVDPERHSAEDVGDEPLLLARDHPTIVAHDRAAGAQAAEAAGASVIVMDDGFQNPSLFKDVSVLVVDGRRGIGNGHVFPAGPLRAPLRPQLRRAAALLVIDERTDAKPIGIAAIAATGATLPVFHGRLVPSGSVVASLIGKPLLAFAGIADPEKFFRTLADAGIAPTATRAFADHHAYTEREAADLIDEARHNGFQLVTTEKDFVRLGGAGARGQLRKYARPLPVVMRFADEGAFRKLLLERIRSRA
jgi:tetraacyldisaccharide 4'-kinase